MFVGMNHFGEAGNLVFIDPFHIPNYQKVEIYGGVIDHLYIDEDTDFSYSTEKPEGWAYLTALNFKADNSMEGGSVEADNIQIEKIRFQKRGWQELEWMDVAEIPYEPHEKVYYEAIDKYIANDFGYQYSILPVAAGSVLGNRVRSTEILADFYGAFISDGYTNYRMLYDVELSDIENNISNAVFEPLNSKFPIVVHSDLDYESFSVKSTFISAETMKKNAEVITIRMERLGKDELLRFMKNGRPKVYRDTNGRLKLVSVVGSPVESPLAGVQGIAKLSFDMVEIGEMDNETLRNHNLIPGLEGVF